VKLLYNRLKIKWMMWFNILCENWRQNRVRQSWFHRLLIPSVKNVSVPRRGVDDHGCINDDAGVYVQVL